MSGVPKKLGGVAFAKADKDGEARIAAVGLLAVLLRDGFDSAFGDTKGMDVDVRVDATSGVTSGCLG